MINCLHHFEILTSSSQKLVSYLTGGFKFELVQTKQVGPYLQQLVRSNSVNFLITSLETNPSNGYNNNNNNNSSSSKINNTTANNDAIFRTSMLAMQNNSSSGDNWRLHNLIRQKANTVFNAAFAVRDLDRIMFNCARHNVRVIKSKHRLLDATRQHADGEVACAIIESCVDGVAHTLLDLRDYRGRFLPGFEDEVADAPKSARNDNALHSLVTHFDHLTYATPRGTSAAVIAWYQNVFNMRHFNIQRDESELIVRTGKSGMNLKAIKYWMCAETGVELADSASSSDFKFVISEPLADDVDAADATATTLGLQQPTSSTPPQKQQQQKTKQSDESEKNQISIFLSENNGPGIQHIGLHTSDIVASVKNSKKAPTAPGAALVDQIEYYATPDHYYQSAEKQAEIEKCGLDVNLLRENHILLDAELCNESSRPAIKSDAAAPSPQYSQEQNRTAERLDSYLLQVFTQPVFDKNTLFFEFIQRVGGAQGFGAANIQALWNAVQHKLNVKASKN